MKRNYDIYMEQYVQTTESLKEIEASLKPLQELYNRTKAYQAALEERIETEKGRMND